MKLTFKRDDNGITIGIHWGRKHVADYKCEILRLDKIVSNKHAMIQNMRADVAECQDAYRTLKTETTKLKERKAELSTELTQTQRSNEHYASHQQELREANETLAHQVNAKRKELEQLNNETSILDERYLGTEASYLHDEVARLRTAKAELNETITKLSEQVRTEGTD